MENNGFLIVEDGTVFKGVSFGYKTIRTGELVFNTSLTGYQEAISDPSYAGQIITFTQPHIGNVGISNEDSESSKAWASGIITRELPTASSNWRSIGNLEHYLLKHQIAGIAEIDTRELTHFIRKNGNLYCCISTKPISIEKAIHLAKEARHKNSNEHLNYITSNNIRDYNTKILSNPAIKSKANHIIIYDFGFKQNIARILIQKGCNVTIVPSFTTVNQIIQLKPDGILLSNGPGNPTEYKEIILTIKNIINLNIPIFGICLGHQLLALACGATIEKLNFGHHGTNHPVKDLTTGKIYITSQNHNFTVSRHNLPSCLLITYLSLFDNSIQGLKHIDKPVLGFQGHPEACPGPLDIGYLFDEFLNLVKKGKSL